MRQIWKSFRALYFASLMMLIGSGLLSTYLALRLAAEDVDGLWVGALMAANYFGLVLGGKIGHRLIARVGHIRAYSACAGIVGAAVLGAWSGGLAAGMAGAANDRGSGHDVPVHGHRELAQRAGRCQPAWSGVQRLHDRVVPWPGFGAVDSGHASGPRSGAADAGRSVLRAVSGAGDADPTDSPGAAASGADGAAIFSSSACRNH